MTRWYDTAKRWLWPHTLVPLGISITVDYIVVFGRIAQLLLCAYVAMQLLAFIPGIVCGMFARFRDGGVWRDVFKYRASTLFPLLSAGFDAAAWLFEETTHEAPQQPEPPT